VKPRLAAAQIGVYSVAYGVFNVKMSSPTTSQDPGDRIPLTPHNCHGPYRSNMRTPRQTLHNRNRRKLDETVQSPTYGGGSEAGTLETHSDKENTCENATDLCLAESLSLMTPQTHLSVKLKRLTRLRALPKQKVIPPHQDCFQAYCFHQAQAYLLIRSYMCRHNLSNQGQEDLQLLQLHLPRDSAALPTSLYTFRK